jgi:hypothetical protein
VVATLGQMEAGGRRKTEKSWKSANTAEDNWASILIYASTQMGENTEQRRW